MTAILRPVICILNGSAGPLSVTTTPDRLAAMFAGRKMRADVWVAGSGAELAALSRRAVAEGHPVIAAGGGDGTLSCVAAALAGTPAILGVLPLGTLNHFAKDLNIPLRLEDAVEVIANGRERIVDVGEVNGRLFLNNSSLGLYPRMVREREKLQGEGSGRWTAFARAIGYVLLRYSQLRVRLDAGNPVQIARTTPFVFIGNNKYRTEGWTIGTRPKLDGGELWLYMAPHRGPGGLILLAVLALSGRLKSDAVDAFQTKECWITTRRRRIDVARDGEVAVMETPLHFRIRPGALRVMAPAMDHCAPAGA